MRILLINKFYYPKIVGGAEISTQLLAEELSKMGNEVFVITNGENKVEVINGVKIYRLKIRNIYQPYITKKKNIIKRIIFRFIDLYNFGNKKIFKKLLDEIKPDVVHLNNLSGFSVSIWGELSKKNIPFIQTIRDYYFSSINSINTSNVVLKVINFFYKIYMKLVSKNVKFISAPSNDIIFYHKKLKIFKNAHHNRIFNVTHFDDKIYKDNLSYKSTRKDFAITFSFLGSVEKHKGIYVLLESFKMLCKNNENQFKLIIAGKGKLYKKLSHQYRNNKNINFVGFLKGSDLQSFWRETDILIVPSIWKEPFGRVIIEAYSKGVPVIASKIGGIKEIVTKNTGILVEPSDIKSLYQGMSDFRDKDKILNISKKLLNYISLFDVRINSEKYKKYYEKILKEI